MSNSVCGYQIFWEWIVSILIMFLVSSDGWVVLIGWNYGCTEIFAWMITIPCTVVVFSRCKNILFFIIFLYNCCSEINIYLSHCPPQWYKCLQLNIACSMMPYLLHHSMTNVYVGMLNTGMAAITVADFEIIIAVGLSTSQAC